jgi:chromosome segregation ATPase
VAQAGQLAAAITTLGADLAGIESQARALIPELQGDIATAQQLPDVAGAGAQVAASVQQQLQQAQAGLTGVSRNPQRVLEALTEANTQIDAAIAQGRESVERARRTQQLLEQTLAQADAQVRSASDFIQTRRGSIGTTARTRLSQAEAGLGEAISLRASNPEQALAVAQNALELARQAASYAQSDVSSYSPGGGWGGDPVGGSRSSGSGLGGDILGGIIGGLLAGGGGGSSRSSSWRSSGGGFRSSGFGGGGGGRSGGGRSGRSGGGRF